MRLEKCALFWYIFAVFLEKGLGGGTDDPFEGTHEMALIIKTELSCNLRLRQISLE